MIIRPTDKENLLDIIKFMISIEGPNADLNYIDTSRITDMSKLFYLSKFNGNISEWNTGNVLSMESMFYGSDFNGDISRWDVSRVTNMRAMFYYSRFNRDISKWDVSEVQDMSWMFNDSKFNKDIGNWDVSSLIYYNNIFSAASDYDKGLQEWIYVNPKLRDMDKYLTKKSINNYSNRWIEYDTRRK
jgi:surface protein